MPRISVLGAASTAALFLAIEWQRSYLLESFPVAGVQRRDLPGWNVQKFQELLKESGVQATEEQAEAIFGKVFTAGPSPFAAPWFQLFRDALLLMLGVFIYSLAASAYPPTAAPNSPGKQEVEESVLMGEQFKAEAARWRRTSVKLTADKWRMSAHDGLEIQRREAKIKELEVTKSEELKRLKIQVKDSSKNQARKVNLYEGTLNRLRTFVGMPHRGARHFAEAELGFAHVAEDLSAIKFGTEERNGSYRMISSSVRLGKSNCYQCVDFQETDTDVLVKLYELPTEVKELKKQQELISRMLANQRLVGDSALLLHCDLLIESSNHVFYVMQKVGTKVELLETLIQARDNGLQELLQLAQFLFKQLAQAIDFLHSKGVAHGNVTTANCIVCGDCGTQPHLKLMDLTFSQSLKGGSGSAPPAAADLRGLGRVFFEMLTGTPVEEVEVALKGVEESSFLEKVKDAKKREQATVMLKELLAPKTELSTAEILKEPWVAMVKWATLPKSREQATAGNYWSDKTPARIGQGEIQWGTACMTMYAGGGSGGVLLVELEDSHAVVVKPQKTAEDSWSELLAIRMAELLEIPVAECRVVSLENLETQAEFCSILEVRNRKTLKPEDEVHIREVLFGKTDLADLQSMSQVSRQYLAVLQFVPGASLASSRPDQVSRALSGHEVCRQIGRLAVLDMILNNMDRLPLPVWDNSGNMNNVMLAPDGSAVQGIDQQVNPISVEKSESYRQRVREFSRTVLDPASSPDLTKVLKALQEDALCGMELPESAKESLSMGLQEGVKAVFAAWESKRFEQGFNAALQEGVKVFGFEPEGPEMKPLESTLDFVRTMAQEVHDAALPFLATKDETVNQ